MTPGDDLSGRIRPLLPSDRTVTEKNMFGERVSSSRATSR